MYDALASLVDRNLVQQKELVYGEPRFVLLEMIHGFARERLEASDEAESMRRRHAEYFVALPIAEASLALFREMNHQPGIAQTLTVIGELARMGGDDERAMRAYEEWLAVFQHTGEVLRTCYNYVNLAYVVQHKGNHRRALELVRQALQISRDRRAARDIASFLVTFTGSAAALAQLRRAVRLIDASEAALERMGAFHQPSDQPAIDRLISAVRAQLDETAFKSAWAEGHKWSLQQAVAEALE